MSIKMTQTCEMCGKTRELPTSFARPKQPAPDSGGWRLLSSGAKEVTVCDRDVALLVDHALRRAAVRQDVAAKRVSPDSFKDMAIFFQEVSE